MSGREDDGATDGGEGQRSAIEQLLARALEPLGMVLLTRERIQETLEEAVQRGRVTRKDANELALELLRRGRQQTEEFMDRARRSIGATPSGPPISDYESLTARQVQARLGELSPGQLRQLREHERRHANRKTVLDAIERALG